MLWKVGKMLVADSSKGVLLLKEATSWLKSALGGSIRLLRGLLVVGLVVPLPIGCLRPDDRSSPDVSSFGLEVAFRLVTSLGLEIASFRDVVSLGLELASFRVVISVGVQLASFGVVI